LPGLLPARSPTGCRGLLGLLVASLLLLTAPLRAHDIYTSFVEARLDEHSTEVTVTLSRSSALQLLPDGDQRPPVTPQNFPDYAAQFQRVAPDLLRISAAGKLLAMKSAKVAISGDADITFTLTYPASAPGLFRVFAQYVGHLVDGHVVTLVLSNGHGDDLGWSPVSIEQPTFQITLKPGFAKPLPKKK
jgi:hypothetical protein